MTQISVVTDNSADIPPDVAARYGITVVPLIVRFGDETFSDVDLAPGEFWRRAAQAPPHTSGASLGEFLSAFQRLVAEGSHVLCLTLTGRHSTVFGAAWSAAREFGDRVTVFDSQSISWGLGWQAIAAAEAAAKGLPLEQIIEAAKDVRGRMSIQLVLDTLSFVRRGGRADHFITVIDKAARTLSIKPTLTFVGGEMKLANLSRTWERGVRRLMTEIGQRTPLDGLAIGHTMRQEKAEEVADEIAAETGFPRQDIRIFEPGVAVASHSGPGLMAALALSGR
jgi:DegV family protein with EDD domain